MKVFRDLFIHASPDQVAALMQDVERSLAWGWRRNIPMEEAFQKYNVRKDPAYCFSCTQEGARPSATVFFIEKQPGLFHASNIAPEVTHQLTHDEYNAILEEFCERFVRPAGDKAGLRVELTSTEAGLDRWLSEDAAKKLRGFSGSANKWTGSSQATDRERWNEFLLAVHHEKSSLDAPTLRRWLIEVGNWPPEVADRLACEYEFSRDLLNFAASRRSA